MFKYNYYIKRIPIPYNLYAGKYQCIRVPEGDIRNIPLTAKYFPIGWKMFIAYHHKPSVEQEIFELRIKHRKLDCYDEFEILDINDKQIAKIDNVTEQELK